MHSFLINNRDELIARCKAKVAQRPKRAATSEQLANGIPLFLQRLTSTLEAEFEGDVSEGERISGPAGGDVTADAVTEFSAQRDTTVSLRHSADENERIGVLVHELRNFLQPATMGFAALESGTVPIGAIDCFGESASKRVQVHSPSYSGHVARLRRRRSRFNRCQGQLRRTSPGIR